MYRNIFSASTPYFIIKNIYIYSLYLVADELHVRVHVALEDAREGTDKPFEGSAVNCKTVHALAAGDDARSSGTIRQQRNFSKVRSLAEGCNYFACSII